jgi:hypothetical protein
MVILTLERVAKEALIVSFIHVDTGAIRTVLYTRNKDVLSEFPTWPYGIYSFFL